MIKRYTSANTPFEAWKCAVFQNPALHTLNGTWLQDKMFVIVEEIQVLSQKTRGSFSLVSMT